MQMRNDRTVDERKSWICTRRNSSISIDKIWLLTAESKNRIRYLLRIIALCSLKQLIKHSSISEAGETPQPFTSL